VEHRVGMTSDTYGYPFQGMHAALDYAKKKSASVINFSVGSRAEDPSFASQLSADGLIAIAAAGNDASDYRAVNIYPASLGGASPKANGNVITVGAVGEDGCLSTFSGRGKSTVDIAAPGVGIRANSIGGVVTDDGTSQAAALVSFTVAVLRSEGLVEAGDVRARLFKTAVKTPNLTEYVQAGGYLNVVDAVRIRDDILYRGGSTSAEYGHLDTTIRLADVCDGIQDTNTLKVERIERGAAGQLLVYTRKSGASKLDDWPTCVLPATSKGVYSTPLSGVREWVKWDQVGILIPS